MAPVSSYLELGPLFKARLLFLSIAGFSATLGILETVAFTARFKDLAAVSQSIQRGVGGVPLAAATAATIDVLTKK